MYDIKPLENEWKRYNLKKRKPIYYMIFFILIILLLSIGNISNIGKYINGFYKTTLSDNIGYTKKLNSLLINNALTKLETKDTSVSNIETSELLVDIPILDVSDSKNDNNEVDKVRKKIFLDIIKSSNVSAYEDVEKRFAQSHDIDDAIFLSRSYYTKNNYKKAAYWAYEVNKLDSNLEEILFIFVKSKVKLGDINAARAILNNYIKKSNSAEAKKILSKINNNTL